MTLKRWMLGRVNDTVKREPRRGDGRVAPTLSGAPIEDAPARMPAGASRRRPDDAIAHLGRYAALVAAIRDELEHFVASQLRLHLAIAEGDRYVLTSVEVECADAEGEAADLLRRFVREFRPEQIKQYLARDVIAGLRNASAIDLTQFAGLNAARPLPDDAEDDAYAALVAELTAGAGDQATSAYRVTLMGRWSSGEAPIQRVTQGRGARMSAADATPMAAREVALLVHDAGGSREMALAGVVPGRRYVIGKDGGCDVVVDGQYASRRHCEIWFDQGRWWAADAGSTNGIRVEWNGEVSRAGARGAGDARPRPIELPPGSDLVLSAHAVGEAPDYPRVTVPATAEVARGVVTAAVVPATPIAPARPRPRAWTLRAVMSTGARELSLGADALPFTIGRSRTQSLVVEWSHADVSGHHLTIDAVDTEGARVTVHGDNGVRVGDTTHAAGDCFVWRPGESLVLGSAGGADACVLTLATA